MKKQKKIFLTRFFIAVIVFILSVLAFTNVFYPIHFFNYQFLPLFERIIIDFSWLSLVIFSILIIITILFGRLYCSILCPFGIYQELLNTIHPKKEKVQKNLVLKYFLSSIIFGFLIAGSACIAKFLDPYTLFGSSLSNTTIGIIAFTLISILVFFKGRFFCSNICPVGTILGIVSKFSLNKICINKDKCVSCKLCEKNCPTGSINIENKTVDNETCVKCLKCISKCKVNAITYGICKKQDIQFDKKRRDALIWAGFLGLSIITFKKFSSATKKTVNKVKDFILPAGAKNKERLLATCLNCNLCVQRCPMKIIKKANNNFNAVSLDYKNGYCKFTCNRCSKRCPSGALHHISLQEKQNTQIGLANVDNNHCIQCGICAKSCPKGAIIKDDGEFPIIDKKLCIGCGKCAFECPTKAIKIYPVTKQRLLTKVFLEDEKENG